ncbi:MAG TPA: TIGR01458 family HAD-type hydrolase [Gammaproteobacteria bacterium]|nr:TIGR01458 family HAD-type hydrolase [Gammaproteobacteria bacterium]
MLRGVLLDLGGVLYVGDAAVPGAVRAMQRLRASGLPLGFVTNTTRSARSGVAARLERLGFDCHASEIHTPSMTARAVIRERGLHPLLLVHPDLRWEFPRRGAAPADAVIVGDAGETFTYDRLNRAFRVLMQGAPLLALARNRYFREPDGLSLDAGAFVAGLEYAAGVSAELLGKPAPGFFRAAVAALGVPAEEVVMIGDDAENDVGGALSAGLQGMLVCTGKYRPGDEAAVAGRADVVADLPEAVERIVGARQ